MAAVATSARRITAALLIAWCAIGVASTIAGLTGPGVWWTRAPVAAYDVVGTPMAGAAEISAIRALLAGDERRADERWLVIFPAAADPFTLMYIRFQLAHLEYPRRVDVAAGSATRAAASYAGIITAPGLRMSDPWRPTATVAGFVRHALAES